MKRFEYAYIWLPFAMLLKDVAATVAMLSNEPGISAANVRHYHLALMPGGLLFGGTGLTWVFNFVFAAAVGLVLHLRSRRTRMAANLR